MAGKRHNKAAAKPRSAKAVNAQSQMREKLGDELRSLYNSVLEEPLPDDMMEFLRDLDRDETDQADINKKDRDDSER